MLLGLCLLGLQKRQASFLAVATIATDAPRWPLAATGASP
jgi:hypothetical protein